MKLSRSEMDQLLYGTDDGRRFTQDSPILPDVWFAYGLGQAERPDLLLTPNRRSSPGRLRREIAETLQPDTRHRLAANEGFVVAMLSLQELIQAVLPLSKWWWRYVWKPTEKSGSGAGERYFGLKDLLDDEKLQEKLLDQLSRAGGWDGKRRFSDDLLQLIRIAGVLLAEPPPAGKGATGHLPGGWERDRAFWERILRGFLPLLRGENRKEPDQDEYPLWQVNRNRAATIAVSRSRQAIKADAAVKLFSISCADLRWAIIDSGIDAGHPAFRRPAAPGGPSEAAPDPPAPGAPARSRVVRTYDFTRLRGLLAGDVTDPPPGLTPEQIEELRKNLRRNLATGRAVDWTVLGPALLVPQDATYPVPGNGHGTHVAGILAGSWIWDGASMEAEKLEGICPDLELYDLRVLDAQGRGDEFSVIAALQFVRHLNGHSDQPVIHGVNLSLALHHDVANYACGRTPVCEECERLVGNGVVVVAAAGNRGMTTYLDARGEVNEDYRFISITDPGNAEAVITVGATHRHLPHTYGVSFFSSRGPTGDGRCKPDLVAPGEKIRAPLPKGESGSLDGTSMAAPHVSGAAALLLARHRELIGQPARVKQILCGSATDLGRERCFQGSGMLDVLRAIQSL